MTKPKAARSHITISFLVRPPKATQLSRRLIVFLDPNQSPTGSTHYVKCYGNPTTLVSRLLCSVIDGDVVDWCRLYGVNMITAP